MNASPIKKGIGRSRGQHDIRRQSAAGITFRAFATMYLEQHAAIYKRSVERDRGIIDVLNRAFGDVLLPDFTERRIKAFMRNRLARQVGRPRREGPVFVL